MLHFSWRSVKIRDVAFFSLRSLIPERYPQSFGGLHTQVKIAHNIQDHNGLWRPLSHPSPVAWELFWLLFSMQMKRPTGTVKSSESWMNFSLKVVTSICHHPRHVSEVTLEIMAEAWAGSFNKRYIVPIVGTTKLPVVLEKHDWVWNVRIWEH